MIQLKKLLIGLTVAFTLGLGVLAAGTVQTSQVAVGTISPNSEPGPGL